MKMIMKNCAWFGMSFLLLFSAQSRGEQGPPTVKPFSVKKEAFCYNYLTPDGALIFTVVIPQVFFPQGEKDEITNNFLWKGEQTNEDKDGKTVELRGRLTTTKDVGGVNLSIDMEITVQMHFGNQGEVKLKYEVTNQGDEALCEPNSKVIFNQKLCADTEWEIQSIDGKILKGRWPNELKYGIWTVDFRSGKPLEPQNIQAGLRSLGRWDVVGQATEDSHLRLANLGDMSICPIQCFSYRFTRSEWKSFPKGAVRQFGVTLKCSPALADRNPSGEGAPRK